MAGSNGAQRIYTAPCGCRVLVDTDRERAYWNFCVSHSIARDCSLAFKQAAPASYAAWLERTECELRERQEAKVGA